MLTQHASIRKLSDETENICLVQYYILSGLGAKARSTGSKTDKNLAKIVRERKIK